MTRGDSYMMYNLFFHNEAACRLRPWWLGATKPLMSDNRQVRECHAKGCVTQLFADVNSDALLLKVQLSLLPICVDDVHQLWSKYPLASCKQTSKVFVKSRKLISHLQQLQ